MAIAASRPSTAKQPALEQPAEEEFLTDTERDREREEREADARQRNTAERFVEARESRGCAAPAELQQELRHVRESDEAERGESRRGPVTGAPHRDPSRSAIGSRPQRRDGDRESASDAADSQRIERERVGGEPSEASRARLRGDHRRAECSSRWRARARRKRSAARCARGYRLRPRLRARPGARGYLGRCPRRSRRRC